MKKFIAMLVCVAVATGCGSTPPKPPQPTGDWTPVNAPLTKKG